MGIGAGTAMLIGTLVSAAGAYAMTPKSPSFDATNYELLAQTQAAGDAENEEQKARLEAARKREELRQQALQSSQIMTSDTGTDDTTLSVKNTVLGRGR